MPRSSIILTTDHVERWREERAGIDEQMAALSARRELLDRLLSAASIVAEAAGENEPDAPPEVTQGQPTPPLEEQGQAPEDRDALPVELTEDMSWTDAVHTGVHAYPLGVVSHTFKDQVSRSALGPRLASSDKGYYNAVSRLAKRGKIVQHNGRLFSPAAFEAYKQAVERGEIADTAPPPAAAYSPMGDAIEEIIASKPGIGSTGIIRELRKDSEFAATLHPRPTVAYNIIARLKRRGRIEKRGDGLYPASQRAEPSREARDGSFEGEDSHSSLNESRPAFRLVS